MNIGETIGQRIRQVRGELSQKKFGERVGLSQTGVTALENDKSAPRLTTLKSIADSFGVNFDWLHTGTGPMKGEAVAPAASTASLVVAEPAVAYGCAAPDMVATLTEEVNELRAENKALQNELRQTRREARQDLWAQARQYNAVKVSQEELISRLYKKLDEYELRLGYREPTAQEREQMQAQDNSPRMVVVPHGRNYREKTESPQAIATSDEPRGRVIEMYHVHEVSHCEAA